MHINLVSLSHVLAKIISMPILFLPLTKEELLSYFWESYYEKVMHIVCCLGQIRYFIKKVVGFHVIFFHDG